MRVLVTGGAGYIGGETVLQLLDRGHEVVVVDDLSNSTRAAVADGAELVVGDVTDPALCAEVAAGVDACLHFAALIEAGESMRRPHDFLRVNTAGTLTLLHALVDAGVERFVLSSTAAVYGEPERVPIDEDHPTAPTNAYGLSKLLVERALPWLAELRGLRYAALRYFNASGASPGRGEAHDPESHLIPIVLEAAAGRREHVAIFGTDYPTEDGTAVRDYIHVTDLAAAHVLALDALDERSRLVCNLGNGRGFSVRQVIDTAARVTGRDVPVREEGRRPGDPAVLVASADRARRELGWVPARDLDEIVASAWRWHASQWGLG